MKKRLSAVRKQGAIAIGAVLLLAACDAIGAEDSDVPAAPPPEQAAVAVQVFTIEASNDASAVRASGLVAHKRESALSFGAPGELDDVRVDVGDNVRSGQTLAVLRRTSVGADEAEAAIAAQTAEQNYERLRRLHESGAVSDVELENARLAVERTRTRVVITAPTSGVILRRAAERGQVVNPGEPVLWLGEARAGVIVRASVTASEAANLKVGADARINIRGRAGLEGAVARISPVSAGAAGVFEVEVAIDDPDGVRNGEVAEVAIATEGGEARTASYRIPALSLIDARADQGVVYVVDETGVARRRAVETGGVDGAGVVILSGLAPGDQVVSRGAALIRDGDPVTIVE